MLSCQFATISHGTARQATARADAPRRHLILGYRPGWQATDDLAAIARHVADLDPTIGTFILPVTGRSPVTRRQAARRPTLIVSPGAMTSFRPGRGKIYAGRPIAKIEQLRRLAAAGVPVPMTEILTPQLRFAADLWGEFVVVKPTHIFSSSHGAGIALSRTSRVRYRAPEEYPAGHPGRLGPMLVQQYIDTGGMLTLYRVLTLFGEPLYCQFMTGRRKEIDLSAPDEAIERAKVANQLVDQDMRFVDDADVLALARAAHDAMPEVPLKGCDIIREAGTGKLYVLEVNPGGNTWHFSSATSAKERRENGAAFEALRWRQFDAMRTAARVLVRRTLLEAI